jgi:hypothetical protein
MLTGDNWTTAKAVARRLGIDEVEAEVLPEQKSQVVRKHKAAGKVVAMAGDGINDAPALALQLLSADLRKVWPGLSVAIGRVAGRRRDEPTDGGAVAQHEERREYAQSGHRQVSCNEYEHIDLFRPAGRH